jgi:hypothetical protein
MSLLSAIILPKLEKELIALQPEIAAFSINQLKALASEVIEWAEKKSNLDINGDGVIGDDKDEKNG